MQGQGGREREGEKRERETQKKIEWTTKEGGVTKWKGDEGKSCFKAA